MILPGGMGTGASRGWRTSARSRGARQVVHTRAGGSSQPPPWVLAKLSTPCSLGEGAGVRTQVQPGAMDSPALVGHGAAEGGVGKGEALEHLLAAARAAPPLVQLKLGAWGVGGILL